MSVIDRPFVVAADLLNLGIGGFDCRQRLGQRLEIASVLEPTVRHPLKRSAQPVELGLVGFGNAVDAGRDLDACCRGCSRLITGDFYAVGQVGHLLSAYRLMTLFALSPTSFAGGIAGVASGLPLSFQGGFPCCLLSEFRVAGLLLGFQRGLTSGSLGRLGSG